MRTAATSCSGVTSLSRKPLAPGVQRGVDVLVEVERGEDDDPAVPPGPGGEDPPGGLQAVHLRHPDVHQHHVGPVLEHGGHGLRPSAASATTGMPAAPRIIRNPLRTRVWSSAITTRGGAGSPAGASVLRPGQPVPAPEGRSPAPGRSAPGPPACGPGPATRRPAGAPPPVRRRTAPSARAGRAGPARPRATRCRGPRRPGWPSGVGHLYHQLAVAVVEADAGPRLARVLEHVGQRLLDDPERGQVQSGRQPRGRSPSWRSTGSPAAVTRSMSGRSWPRPGCGRRSWRPAGQSPGSSLAGASAGLSRPSRWRSSVMAARPLASTASSAAGPRPGRRRAPAGPRRPARSSR